MLHIAVIQLLRPPTLLFFILFASLFFQYSVPLFLCSSSALSLRPSVLLLHCFFVAPFICCFVSLPPSLGPSSATSRRRFVHLLLSPSFLLFFRRYVSSFSRLWSNHFSFSPYLGLSILPFVRFIVRLSLHLTFSPSQ